MALIESTAVRADDNSGKPIKTGTDGGGNHIQYVAPADENGAHTGVPGNPLAVENRAAVTSSATGESAANAALIVAGAALVYAAEVLLTVASGGDRWLMIIDKATTPVDDDNAIWRAFVPQGGQASIAFDSPISVAAGFAVAISTSPDKLVLPGSPEGYFQTLRG